MSVWLFLGSLWLIVWGYSSIWKKTISGKLDISFQAADDLLIAGDIVTLTTVIQNPSWLPMPLVEVWLQLPEGMEADYGDRWKPAVMYSTYLLPKQRVSFQQNLKCCARGYHRLGDVEIKLGDGLGLSTVYEETETQLALLVRPRPLEDTQFQILCEELIGETSVIRWYQEDASRLQGIRSYQSGDPFRYLHWAATARTGNFMVKQFETTSESQIYVVPNAQFFETHRAGGSKLTLEYQYQIAATLLCLAQDQQYSYGLYTNAAWQGIGTLTRQADRGSNHLEMLLTLLGGLTHQAVCSFAELLLQIRETVSQSSTLVLLTPYWNAELDDAVSLLLRNRHRVLIVTTTADVELWKGLDPSVSVVMLDEEELSRA